MRILALDPGTLQTGWCILHGSAVERSGVHANERVLAFLQTPELADSLAIEMVASYGMAVGREVFETVRWIGRFQQAWRDPEAVHLVYRQEVKLHLCKTVRAKDPNVRQALIDLYPATGGGACPQIGTKKQPGPLYGVSSHAWPALGVAVVVQSRARVGTWTSPIEQAAVEPTISAAEARRIADHFAGVPF